MSDEQVLAEAKRLLHNCRYWSTSPQVVEQAERMMQMPIVEWAPEAQRLLKAYTRQVAVCGEVVIAAALEWAHGEEDAAQWTEAGLRYWRRDQVEKARLLLREPENDQADA